MAAALTAARRADFNAGLLSDDIKFFKKVCLKSLPAASVLGVFLPWQALQCAMASLRSLAATSNFD